MVATDFTEISYWLGTRAYAPGPALEGDVDVDVAVVGGGFTGLTSSYFLTQADPGLRVAVLESEVVGFGASGRNAGFSMTKIGMMHSLTAMRFGKTRALEAHEYADRAVDLVHELVDKLGLDCDYEHPGFLWVATSEGYRKRLLKEIALVHRLGITGIHLIDGAELRARVDSPLYVGGAWWEPNCGLLNPAKLAWAWRDVVTAAGVQVYERTPVSQVERTGGRSVLTTPRGRVTARKVVFATNAWSHLFPQFVAKQVPVWTYIVLTEPLTPAQLDSIGWRGREGVEDFRDLVHYYRLTADNRLLIGGRDVGLGDGRGMGFDSDETVFAALRSDVRAMFPGLRDVGFSHAWGGPVSATLDLFPALGYAGGKDAVYAFGCVGHGVSTTHLHGQVVRDLVLERDSELTETFFVNRRLVPFPPGPLGLRTVQGIAGFMRWEDRRLDVLP
ncbi:MAG: FAD-binding oxidoreductase [Actinomycetia bacterium]|jgi:glycine/D-amino acid oxidase-like deaminating enzyme|nr:FAD-binding oxidoreductase [Actinomycetes bacterium]